MAHNLKADNFRHLQRIAIDLFEPKGRSQRTEFVVFLGAMLVVTAIAFLVSLIFFSSSGIPYGQYLQLALWIPAIPLFVRRLHDQNRTGWLAVLMPALLALKAYEQAQFLAGNLLRPGLNFPYNLAEGVLAIGFWVLVGWPGTRGENRFGPDPRQGDIVVVS